MKVLDRAKARSLGFSDEEIDEYLKKQGLQELGQTQTPQVKASSPVASFLQQGGADSSAIDLNAPVDPNIEQSAVEKFLRSDILSTGTSIGGGILGALAGGGIGGIAGGAAGEGLGETLERGLLYMIGEDPDENPETGVGEDVKGILGETALAGLFGVGGSVAGKAVKAGSKGVAKLLNLEPENFVQRAIKVSPTESAKMNAKYGFNDDAERTVHKMLLKDEDLNGVNIFDLPVEQRPAFAQYRIGQLADERRGVYAQFANATKDADLVKSKVLQDMDDIIYMPGTRKLTQEGDAIMKMVDEQFEHGVKTYGKTWTPETMENFENSLSKGVKNFQQTGKVNPEQIETRIKNSIAGLNKDIPGVRELNRKMAAYYDVRGGLTKAAMPDYAYGMSFGSAAQSAPAFAAGNMLSPQAGAVMYLTSFFGSQVSKDPEMAGKLARLLFKTKNAISTTADEVPPFLKRFYTAVRPAVVQGGRAAVTGDSGQSDTSDVLLDEALPMPDELGATDMPEGMFIEKGALGEKDGKINARKTGMTKQDAALAMLMYPKQRTLIKDIYELMKVDEDEDGLKLDSKQQEEMRKVEALSAIITQSKYYMGKIGAKGKYAGGASILADKIFDNNADLAAYERLRSAALPVVARVIGGDVGNLNEFEQKRVEGMLPSVMDTPEKAAQKFAILETLLDERVASIKSGASVGASEEGSGETDSSEEDEEFDIVEALQVNL